MLDELFAIMGKSLASDEVRAFFGKYRLDYPTTPYYLPKECQKPSFELFNDEQELILTLHFDTKASCVKNELGEISPILHKIDFHYDFGALTPVGGIRHNDWSQIVAKLGEPHSKSPVPKRSTLYQWEIDVNEALRWRICYYIYRPTDPNDSNDKPYQNFDGIWLEMK